jgi:uncharacterized protein (TIGR02598 family)
MNRRDSSASVPEGYRESSADGTLFHSGPYRVQRKKSSIAPSGQFQASGNFLRRGLYRCRPKKYQGNSRPVAQSERESKIASAPKFSRSRKAGFSLVEVTISLGICAVGLLLTVALLPTVLDQLNDAADRNAYARIKQSISGRYAMMEWGLLEDSFRGSDVDLYYFDFSGTEVDKESFDAVYAAEVQVGQRRTLTGDDVHNRFIRTLEIKVTQQIQEEDAFTDPDLYDILTASLGNQARLSNEYRD